MKNFVHKLLAFLMVLIMLFDASPVSALAEALEGAGDQAAPIVTDAAEPQKLSITLPKEQPKEALHTLEAGEYTVTPVEVPPIELSVAPVAVPQTLDNNAAPVRGLLMAAPLQVEETAADSKTEQSDLPEKESDGLTETHQISGSVAYEISLTENAATNVEQYIVPVDLSANPVDLLSGVDDKENAEITKVSYTLYHIHTDSDGQTTVSELEQPDVDRRNESILGFSFKTDSFSTFVLSYTVDFVYIEKKAEISIDLGNFQANSNELGQLLYKNSKGLEELAVSDILDFAQDYLQDENVCGEVYTVSLQNGTALSDFDQNFFANSAVSIEGKGIEYGSGKITLLESFDEAKITFASEAGTLELTLENYTAPEKPVIPDDDDGFSYRFFTEEASIAEILAANEIVSSYYSIVSLSDENLVTIKGDELIAENYFDEVILTVSLSDGTEVEITLTNPAPVKAGETVTTEGVGSFAAKDEVPAGTVLTVNTNPKIPEGIVLPGTDRKSETVSDPVFFDISLIGPDGKEIQTGASVTISTEIALPQEDGKVTKVTDVKVYHIGEKGDVEELKGATYALGEGKISSVSFTTGGFSLFAVTYTVDFVASEVEAAWSWPGQGSYKIADILAEIGVEGTVESVTLERVEDKGGAANVLYLSDDHTELISEEAFFDTFELKVVVDGVTYTFTVTDDVPGSGWGDLNTLAQDVHTVVLNGQDDHTTQEMEPNGTFSVRVIYQINGADNVNAAANASYQHTANDLGITGVDATTKFYAWSLDITDLAQNSSIAADYLTQNGKDQWQPMYESGDIIGYYRVVKDNSTNRYYVELASFKSQADGKSEVDGHVDLNIRVYQNSIDSHNEEDITFPGGTEIKVKFKNTETEQIVKDTQNGQKYFSFYSSEYRNGYYYLTYLVDLTEPEQVNQLSMADYLTGGQEFVPGSVSIQETIKSYNRTITYEQDATHTWNVSRGEWTEDTANNAVGASVSGRSFNGNVIDILGSLNQAHSTYTLTQGTATNIGGNSYTRTDTKQQSVYTVTYQTRISKEDLEAAASANGGSAYLQNRARIIKNGTPTSYSDQVTVQLNPKQYNNGTKYSTSDTNGQQAANPKTKNENGKYEIRWTNEISEPEALTRLTFSDVIGTPAYFKAGSLVLTDGNDNPITIVDPSALQVSADGKSFTFDLAAAVGGVTEANKTYRIKYATEVNPEDVPTTITVRNTVTWTVDGENKPPVDPTVTLIPGNYVDHSKRVDYQRIVEGDSGYEATWTIEINEPMDSDNAILTDTYDNRLTLDTSSFELYIDGVKQSTAPSVSNTVGTGDASSQFIMDLGSFVGGIQAGKTYKIVYKTTCATTDTELVNHSQFHLDDNFDTNDKTASVIYEKGHYTDGWKTADPASGSNVYFDTNESTKTIHYTVNINEPIAATEAVLTERYTENQTMDFGTAQIKIGNGTPITVDLTQYRTSHTTDNGIITDQFDLIAALRAATGDNTAIIEANTPITISYDGTVNLTAGEENTVSNQASWHFNGNNGPDDHPGGNTHETYIPKGFNPGTKDVYYNGTSVNGRTLALTDDDFPIRLSYRIQIYEQASATSVELRDSFNGVQTLDTSSFKLSINGGTPMTIPAAQFTQTSTSFTMDLNAVLAYLHDNGYPDIDASFQAETNYLITYDTTVAKADFSDALTNGMTNSDTWYFNNSPQPTVNTRVDLVENQMSKTSKPTSGSTVTVGDDNSTTIHMVITLKNPTGANLTGEELRDVMTTTPVQSNSNQVYKIVPNSVKVYGDYTRSDQTPSTVTMDASTQPITVYYESDMSGFHLSLNDNSGHCAFDSTAGYRVEYDVQVLGLADARTYNLVGTYHLNNRATFMQFSAETNHDVVYPVGSFTNEKHSLGFDAENGVAWWEYIIHSSTGVFPAGYSVTEKAMGWSTTDLTAAQSANNMSVNFTDNMQVYKGNWTWSNNGGMTITADKILFTENLAFDQIRFVFKTTLNDYTYNAANTVYVYNDTKLNDTTDTEVVDASASNNITFQKEFSSQSGNRFTWTITIEPPTGQTLKNWELTEEKYGIGASLADAMNGNGMYVDWSSFTLTNGAENATWHSNNGTSVVFDEIRGRVVASITTVSTAETGGTSYVYNKAGLRSWETNVKLIDDANTTVNSYKIPVRKTNNGNKENIDPDTLEQEYHIILNENQFTFSPDSTFALTDTLPAGMELARDGAATLYKRVGDGSTETISVTLSTSNTGSGTQFTYTSDAGNTISGTRYELVYWLKFTDTEKEVILTNMANGAFTFENTVTVTKTDSYEPTTSTSTFQYTYDDFVDKEDLSGHTLPGDTISYRITVNQRGAKLSDSNYLILEDVIPQDTELVPNSVRVTRGDGTALSAQESSFIEIGYDGLTRKLRVKVPDETYYVVTFNVRSEELHTTAYDFRNTVNLIGKRVWDDTVTTQHVVNNYNAEQTTYNSGIVIRKRDGNNITKLLSGAKFQLYRAVMKNDGQTLAQYYAGNAAEMEFITPADADKRDALAADYTYHSFAGDQLEIDHWEFVSEKETNDKGIIYFDGLALRQLYYIVEVEAPLDETGRPYSIGTNATPYHFILFDDAQKEEYHPYYEDRVYKLDDAISAVNGIVIDTRKQASIYTATNTKTVDVPVTKEWLGDSAEDRPAAIRVQLYRDGVDMSTLGETDNYQRLINEGLRWTYTYRDLPAGVMVGDDYHEYTYTAVEIGYVDANNEYHTGVPTGYVDVSNADNGLTISNRKITEKTITVVKRWADDNNSGYTRPASINVKLYMYSPTKGFGLVYDNIYDSSAIDGEIQLNAGNNWTYTWTGLSSSGQYDAWGDNVNDIEYYLLEEPVTDYDAAYSGAAQTIPVRATYSGTSSNITVYPADANNIITVTNTLNKKGSLTLEKTWTDAPSEITDAMKNSVTFDVIRTDVTPNEIIANAIPYLTVYTAEAHKYKIEDLDPGTYKVVENIHDATAPSGYQLVTTYTIDNRNTQTVSITGQDAVATINNKYVNQGSLKITKTIATETGINLTEAELDTIYSNISFLVVGPNKYRQVFNATGADGAAQITYDTNDGATRYFTIPNLLANSEYTVTEFVATDNPDYVRTTTYRVNSGNTQKVTIPSDGTTGEITVTNHYDKKGELTINKRFVGYTPANLADLANVTFRVSSNVSDFVDTFITMADEGWTESGGVYSYTLKELEAGTYIVEETVSKAVETFTCEATYQVGADSTNQVSVAFNQTNPSQVDVTNTYTKEAQLKLHKDFHVEDGVTLTDAQKKRITFTITGPNGYSQTVSYADFVNGEYTIEHLAKGTYTVVEDASASLPNVRTVVETVYKVPETADSTESGVITLEPEGSGTVTIDNTYKPKGMKVTKVWLNPDGSAKDVPVNTSIRYKIRYTNDYGTDNQTVNSTYSADGHYAGQNTDVFTLTYDGTEWSTDVFDLPTANNSRDFHVVEVDTNGNELTSANSGRIISYTYEGTSGTTVPGGYNGTATITNQDRYPLSVTKSWLTSAGVANTAPDSTTIYFVLKRHENVYGNTETLKNGQNPWQITFDGTSWSTVTISNLLIDEKYTYYVQETNASGTELSNNRLTISYTATPSGGSASALDASHKVADPSGYTFTIINQDRAPFKVTKKLLNAAGAEVTANPSPSTFYFKLYKTQGDYLTAVSNDYSGTYSLTFANGHWSEQTFEGLPVLTDGWYYVVYETNAQGYRLQDEASPRNVYDGTEYIITYVDENDAAVTDNITDPDGKTITIVNQPKLPLTVTKRLLDVDGNVVTSNPTADTFYFVLYQYNTNTNEYGNAVTNSSNNGWVQQLTWQYDNENNTGAWSTVTFVGLPKLTDGMVYVVRETDSTGNQLTASSGYSISYLNGAADVEDGFADPSGMNVTIVNQPLTPLIVTKRLLDENGDVVTVNPTPDTFYFILYKHYATHNNAVEKDGSAIQSITWDRANNKWNSVTYENLSVPSASDDFTYIVKEVKGVGNDAATWLENDHFNYGGQVFDISYEHKDGGTVVSTPVTDPYGQTITIVNSPAKTLKVTKSWQDDDGNEKTFTENKTIYYSIVNALDDDDLLTGAYSVDKDGNNNRYYDSQTIFSLTYDASASTPGWSTDHFKIPAGKKYKVVETDSSGDILDRGSGYRISYQYSDETENAHQYVEAGTDSTAAIVNKDNGPLEVTKSWLDGYGLEKSFDSDQTVYFVVMWYHNANWISPIQENNVNKIFKIHYNSSTHTWSTEKVPASLTTGFNANNGEYLYIQETDASGNALNDNNLSYSIRYLDQDGKVVSSTGGITEQEGTTVTIVNADKNTGGKLRLEKVWKDYNGTTLTAAEAARKSATVELWKTNKQFENGGTPAEIKIFDGNNQQRGIINQYTVTQQPIKLGDKIELKIKDVYWIDNFGVTINGQAVSYEKSNGELTITFFISTPNVSIKYNGDNYNFDSCTKIDIPEVNVKIGSDITLNSANNWKWQGDMSSASYAGNSFADYDYYFVETSPASGYDITYSVEYDEGGNRSGSVSSGLVTITNKEQAGSLQITKAFLAGSDGEGQDFTFEVTLNSGSFTGNVTVTDKTRNAVPVAAVNGKITVTVTGAGTATLANLPVGTTYSVAEQSKSGWTQIGAVEYADANQTIAANDTDTAIVTNAQTGALSITKNVTVNGEPVSDHSNASPADGEYVFSVVGPTGAEEGTQVTKYVKITVTNGQAVSYKVADANTTEAWAAATSINSSPAIVDGLAAGSYVISEQAPANTATLEAAARGDGDTSAVDLSKNVTVVVTAGVDAPAEGSNAAAIFTNNITVQPAVKKTVWDINDSTGIDSIQANGEKTYNDTADHDMGDDIKYRVECPIPGNPLAADVTSYPFTLHDDMQGLKYKSGRMYFVVMHGDGQSDYYDVTTSFNMPTAGSNNLYISPKSENGLAGITSGYSVGDIDPHKLTQDRGEKSFAIPEGSGTVYTFTAADKLTRVEFRYLAQFDNPTFGSLGNLNETWFTYGANGESSSHDYNRVFTYKLRVNKTDGTDALPGATFSLYKDTTGKPLDGTTERTWTLVSTIESTEANPVTIFTWEGIDDGIYKLVETPPTGYQKPEDIVFVVNATHEVDAAVNADPKLSNMNDTRAITAGYTAEADIETGVITVKTTGSNSASIVNVLSVDVPVTKTWAGPVDASKIESITYKISRTLPYTDEEGTYEIDDGAFNSRPTSTVTVTSSNWGYTWKNLPKTGSFRTSVYDSESEEDKEVTLKGTFTYEVEETEFVYDGVRYEKNNSEWTASYTPATGNPIPITRDEVLKQWTMSISNNNNTATATNTFAFTNVTVEKVWVPVAGTSATLSLYMGESEATAMIKVADITLDGRVDENATSITTIKGATVTGVTMKEDSAWHATFAGLPKYGYKANSAPYEIKYVIKEDAVPDGYTVSYSDGNNYTLSGGTITNTKKPGDLELTKLLTGEGADADKPFEFTITLTAPEGGTLANSYSVVKTSATGDATTETQNLTWVEEDETSQTNKKGYFTVTLAKNEKIVVKDLPAGTTFSITETDYTYNGYTSEAMTTPQTGTIEGGTAQSASVTVTNVYSTKGSLKLKKIVKVNGADDTTSTNSTFTFTITGKAETATADISKTVVITLNNGTYTATIADQGGTPAALGADGGYFVITDLPLGDYTITETDANREGYVLATTFKVNNTASVNGEVTLDSTTPTATVECTNDYTPGVELPSTGGPGTVLYTAAGLSLLLGAAFFLLRRRKTT